MSLREALIFTLGTLAGLTFMGRLLTWKLDQIKATIDADIDGCPKCGSLKFYRSMGGRS